MTAKKKTIRTLVAVTVLAAAASAMNARTAADFLVEAPEDALPLLSTNSRMDMLDYFRYGSDRSVTNRAGGNARILNESERTITFDVDSGVCAQLAVLVSGRDTILALVSTVASPALDSRLDFFRTDWQPLRRTPLSLPEYTDWLTDAGRDDIATVSRVLPFVPVEARFDSTATTLTLTSGARTFLAPREYEFLRPMLVDSLVYDIKGNKFKLRKP